MEQRHIQLVERNPNILNRVVQISCGDEHAMVLLDNNTIVVWGRNAEQQCNIPPAVQGHVTQVCAGAKYSLVLLDDNTVQGWGKNTELQCNVPHHIQGNIIKIAAGKIHSLALLRDYQLCAWGSNSARICNIPRVVSSELNRMPRRDVQIACSSHNSFVLINSTLHIWGSNALQLLNIPANIQNHISLIAPRYQYHALVSENNVPPLRLWGVGFAVEISNELNMVNQQLNQHQVVQIACGAEHSMALDEQGIIHAWGRRRHNLCNVPQRIQTHVLNISAGKNFSLALLDDGTVSAWGWNTLGQLNVPLSITIDQNPPIVVQQPRPIRPQWRPPVVAPRREVVDNLGNPDWGEQVWDVVPQPLPPLIQDVEEPPRVPQLEVVNFPENPDEILRLAENMKCPVCKSNISNLVFECGHFICSECHNVMIGMGDNNCPMCRRSSVPRPVFMNEFQKKYIKYKQKYFQLKNKYSTRK